MDNLEKNIVMVLARFMEVAGVSFSVERIREGVARHPDYPSLLALSECLREWGFETKAVRGSVSDLSVADYPGIACLKNNVYAVLEKIDNEGVRLFLPYRGVAAMSLEVFNTIWSGVILRVSVPGGAGVGKEFAGRGRGRTWGGVGRIIVGVWPWAAAGVWMAAAVMFGAPVGVLLLGMLKFIGLLVCMTLFSGLYGGGHWYDKLCSGEAVSGCRRVTDSPAGKIFGIPMADIGVVYFSGGIATLFQVIHMANPAPVLFFLGVVSIMAFPYTLFSLVYQGWVIRSWCRWCLVIQAVLWLECIVVFFFSLRIRPGVFPGDAIPAVIGFGIAVCVWFGLRPVLEHHFQFREKDLELRRVYSKPEYIGLRLAGTAKTVMEVFPRELTVGSPSAPVTLCLAIHPECRHCGEAFREMMALMDLPGGKVRGVIRFYVAFENEGHRGKGKNRDWEVARLILAMMLENREEQAISALGEWFSGDIHSRGFYKRWMRRHGGRASALLGEADGLLERHAQWIKAAGIRAAPALFVNDTALIPPMRFKHLKYFLMRKKN